MRRCKRNKIGWTMSDKLQFVEDSNKRQTAVYRTLFAILLTDYPGKIMRSSFLLYSLLAIFSLWIGCTNEARAQSVVSEIVLRDGTIRKATVLEKMDAYWVFLKDDPHQGVSREEVSLICFADCKDATH